MRVLRALLCGIVFTGGMAAQDFAEEFGKLMDQARGAEAKDKAGALKFYRSAHELAANAHDGESQTDAALGVARMLEATDHMAEAETFYGEAARLGTGAQLQIAVNNLGALQLRLGRDAEALASFQKIDFASVDPSAVYLFRYNYGQALERNGRLPEAFREYSTSVELEPAFLPAVRRAIALAPGLPEAASICEHATDAGAPAALGCLHAALTRFVSQAEALSLVGALAGTYVTSRMDRKTFAKNEDAFLSGLTPQAPPATREAIEELQTVFQKPLEPAWGSSAAKAAFPRLRELHGIKYSRNLPATKERDFGVAVIEVGQFDLSALLLLLANDEQKSGHASEAMGFYAAAWSARPRDLEAPLGFVSVLNNHPGVQGGRDSVLNLVDELFPNKKLAVQTPDLSEVFRLHMALGAALERGHGCPATDAADDPRTPLFHWLQAAEVANRMRAQEPSLPRNYFLYRSLAGCARSGDNSAYKRYEQEGFRSYRSVYTTSDRLRYHFHAAIYAGSELRLLVQAGLDQWLNNPPPWGQGAKGYARRFGSAAGERVVRQSLAFGLDAAFQEEPHFLRLGRSGVKARVGNVLRQTLVCYNSRGNYTFSFWRVGSAFGSAFISNGWRPDNYNTLGDGLVRGALALAGDTGSNALKEFLPDFKRVKGLRWVGTVVTWFLR